MYQNMQVKDLRSALRGRSDLCLKHGLKGTDIIYMGKDALLNILDGNHAPIKETPEPVIESLNKDNGRNGDLSKVIANAIQDHITLPDQKLDEHAVQELIDRSINDRLNTTPIKIETVQGEIKDVGLQHKIFEPALKLISSRIDIMFVGPAGSGKTTLCENIASALDLEFYFIPVGLQTTKSDLIGYKDANGRYIPTHLRQAYEHGGVFLLDEIDAGNPNVLTVINAMLSNGLASFPDRIVRRHKDFVFIAAGNTYGRGSDRQYVGRNPIDQATMDRFAVLDFDYDPDLERALSTNKEWTSYVQDIRAAVEILKEKLIVSPRASIKGSIAISLGFTWEQTADMFIFRGINPEIKSRVLSQVKGT